MILELKHEDAEVRALLRGLQHRAGNLTLPMRVIGQIVRSSVVRNFQEGGRPRKWEPSRRALRDRGETLVDTGRLRTSIHSKAYADRAEVGTDVIYAAIHQLGGKAGRGRKVSIPARPYLMVQDEDWTEIKSVLTDWLTQGAG